jgi:hypothetical protein
MISGDYDSRDKEDKKVHSMLKRAKAYLEKKKEPKPMIKKGVKYYCIKAQKRRSDFYTYAFTVGTEYVAPEDNVLIDNDGHSWDLTTQTPEWIFERFTPKEQKPEVKIIIPKFRVGDIIISKAREKWEKPDRIIGIESNGYNTEPVDTYGGGFIGFSFEDKYELYEQQSAEWSEEDIDMFGSILSTLSICSNNPDIPKDNREIHKREYDWFNKLYHRGCHNFIQECSEEDKKMLEAIVGDIHCGADFNAEVIREANKREKWLRERLNSLRPQPHWKPSEEQMVALSDVKDDCVGSQYEIINSLWRDLKSL